MCVCVCVCITGCTSVQVKKISAQVINVKLLQNKSVKLAILFLKNRRIPFFCLSTFYD